MVWAITVLVVTIGLIAFALYKMANMGYAVRRLKIELSYSEAVDVKYALEDVIKANQECLKDENFKKNYPGCANSLEQQLKRCQAVKQRIQEQLDRL